MSDILNYFDFDGPDGATGDDWETAELVAASVEMVGAGNTKAMRLFELVEQGGI